MGESQSFSSSNNPVFIVIMRNSRGKLFVYVTVLSVLCFFVFLLSNTHTNLKELEGVNEKCQQQIDSLSAQLQVVYEHKNRLEKSLQQEKTDHRHSKDVKEKETSELENKLQKEKEEKQKLQAQILQLKTSYTDIEEEKTQAENALKQQLKTVQTQKDAEIEKLQNHISELLSEKDKLEVSNNAYVWKIEQLESEVNLCHLQLQQAKAEFNTCQEQLAHHNLNTIDTKLIEKPTVVPKKLEESLLKFDNKSPSSQPEVTSPVNKLQVKEVSHTENKTVATAPVKEKPFEKPHVMPLNNFGDGVLPKPLDLKQEELNREDKDAAIEITDDEKFKKLGDDNLLDNVLDPNASKYGLLNDKKIDLPIHKEDQNLNNMPFNEIDNAPQALPPVQFDRADEKDDHAGERGDDGLQYANADLKQQVEIPDFKRNQEPPKGVLPNPNLENNDIAAAQMNDMMNKSPGNVMNNAADQNVLGMPPHDLGPIDNKIHDLKNGGPFLHRGNDVHQVMKDNNYEEDDDDRENDDEPLNGVAPVKNNLLQDNDFDDQENGDNPKEEEGVMAAPK